MHLKIVGGHFEQGEQPNIIARTKIKNNSKKLNLRAFFEVSNQQGLVFEILVLNLKICFFFVTFCTISWNDVPLRSLKAGKY